MQWPSGSGYWNITTLVAIAAEGIAPHRAVYIASGCLCFFERSVAVMACSRIRVRYRAGESLRLAKRG
jgi:hypothetical protein